MTLFKKKWVIILLLSANSTFAQPTYWDKAEQKYNQDTRDRIKDNSNLKSSDFNYKSHSTPNPPIPYVLMSEAEKAAYNKLQQEYSNSRRVAEYEARQREEQRVKAHNDYLQRIANENATIKRNFINDIVKLFNTSYTKLEIQAYAEQDFYHQNSNGASGKKILFENSLIAVKSINKLKLAEPNTPLDSLVSYVWDARFFTDYSLSFLKKIQNKYPEQKSFLERNELRIMGYYFGISTPYVTSEVGYIYPLCGFELMNDEQKIKILNRFEELESLYPELAIKAAGLSRVGFNMYYKYATSNLILKNKTDDKRLEYLYKALATKQQNYILPPGGFKEETWKFYADQYLKGIATELKLMYPNFVQNLTTEQWLNLSDTYQMNVKYIAWAFREDDKDKNYLKKYPNLKNALKDEFKKEEDGEGSITFENRDTYKGDIKNGKPNGQGKLTTATGNTFEGNFKNGALHGKGKAYYKNDVTFTNGKNSAGFKFFAGDIYDGDYNNGLREGKGTLYNTDRKTKYVGDWKNDEKDGEGEETFITNALLLPNTYKGGFKEGRYNGFGIITYANKESYTGKFEDGRYEGKGVFKYANGNTLQCNWDRNNIDGKAILTTANGYIMKYDNKIKKEYYKRNEFRRSISKANIKYYNSSGKEIDELEFTKNTHINASDIRY